MITFALDPMMEYKRRQKELLNEVARNRLLKEALMADRPRSRSPTKILAWIRKAVWPRPAGG